MPFIDILALRASLPLAAIRANFVNAKRQFERHRFSVHFTLAKEREREGDGEEWELRAATVAMLNGIRT